MNDTIQQIYEQIEAIKSTININASNDKPEQWIQRQNLQDLYHQAILDDIDFTIDKKLEQDLWNYVFKTQINHFQTQIKDKKNSKRSEAQANLFFFLEAARGFYTNLLQDIILEYDIELPFCKNFNFLSINYFNQKIKFNNHHQQQQQRTKNEGASGEDDDVVSEINNNNNNSEKTKEKQIMYICQHILTHLGDIARYANMFDQAKSYYLHAIKLVPYLGHPYNQLGILFETSRTNQLSTVFYYIRSIAVRYTFPLAATNLENFFNKLIDIPISRYPLDIAKLTHKDYIQLFLQLNAFIYTQQQQQNTSKIQPFLDLFKTISNLIASSTTPTTTTTTASTAFAFEKFDSVYLCQMMAILFFMLNRFNNELNVQQFNIVLNILVYLLEQCVSFFKEFTNTQQAAIMQTSKNVNQQVTSSSNVNNNNDESFVLPGFYLAFNYLEQLSLVNTNLFQNECFKQNHNLWLGIVKLLNSFQINKSQLDEEQDITETNHLFMYKDYPLNEDRNLDSFMPLKDVLKEFNFKKYFNNKHLLNEFDESLLRKLRITDCFKRLISLSKGDFNYLNIVNDDDAKIIQFELKNEYLSNLKPVSLAQLHLPTVIAQTTSSPSSSTVTTSITTSTITTTTTSSSLNTSPIPTTITNDVQSSGKKKRQNVAISTLTNKNQQQQQQSPQVHNPNINEQMPIKNQYGSKIQSDNSPLLTSSNNYLQNFPKLPPNTYYEQQNMYQQQQQQQKLYQSASQSLQQQASNLKYSNNITRQQQPPQAIKQQPFTSTPPSTMPFNMLPQPTHNQLLNNNPNMINKAAFMQSQDTTSKQINQPQFQNNLQQIDQRQQLASFLAQQQQQQQQRTSMQQFNLQQQQLLQQQQQLLKQSINFPLTLPDPLKNSSFTKQSQHQNQYQFNQQNTNDVNNLQQQYIQAKNHTPPINFNNNPLLLQQQQQQQQILPQRFPSFNEMRNNMNSNNFPVFPSFFDNSKSNDALNQQSNALNASPFIDNLSSQLDYSNMNSNIWSSSYNNTTTGNNNNNNTNTTTNQSIKNFVNNKITIDPISSSASSSSTVTPTPFQTLNNTNNNDDFGLNLNFNTNNSISSNLLWSLNEASNRMNTDNTNFNYNPLIGASSNTNANINASKTVSHTNNNTNNSNTKINDFVSSIWSFTNTQQRINSNNNSDEPS